MLEHRSKLINEIEKRRDSTVLIYVHDTSLKYAHVPMIYNALRKKGVVKNLDIFLSSGGGDPDAAYKIVRMCREHCSGKLSVIVPFMAKSAATLLAIGTDEVVMGPPSELGPIDPQIKDKASETFGATQSIRDCIDFLEKRFSDSKMPNRTSYVLMPILDKLNPFMIGKYERAVKMSKQYAEILLKNGMLQGRDKSIIDSVVGKLSESYYSHGYAIDSREAKDDLHLNVVNADEELWEYIWNLFLTYHYEMEQSDEYLSFIETKDTIEESLYGFDEDDVDEQADETEETA
ncbi:SDH family Clp fold serine proteinase [Cohnella terricola]|uniref:Peptidase n=1 Tax=Cohnella terricola TaxID=1289167 RepID=A0A559JL65_9BACL|nr:peptidase [Cohnella terricola]TVY00627.1 peptidase [Cohnella terricola]